MAGLLTLLLAIGPQEAPRILEAVSEYEKARRWRFIFSAYAESLQEYRGTTVVSDDVNVPMSEHLLERISRLPREAREEYRRIADGRARAAFATRDDAELARALDLYFFATGADIAMDSLANRLLDRGRVQEAIFHWNRLLRYWPETELPREVIAAKIACAATVDGDAVTVRRLCEYVKAGGVDGSRTVLAGGRRVALANLLTARE